MTEQASRKVSIPLIIGIVLCPMIFVWFTLRKGYSSNARYKAFAWLIAALLIGHFNPHTPKASVASAPAISSSSPRMSHEEAYSKVESIKKKMEIYQWGEHAVWPEYQAKIAARYPDSVRYIPLTSVQTFGMWCQTFGMKNSFGMEGQHRFCTKGNPKHHESDKEYQDLVAEKTRLESYL